MFPLWCRFPLLWTTCSRAAIPTVPRSLCKGERDPAPAMRVCKYRWQLTMQTHDSHSEAFPDLRKKKRFVFTTGLTTLRKGNPTLVIQKVFLWQFRRQKGMVLSLLFWAAGYKVFTEQQQQLQHIFMIHSGLVSDLFDKTWAIILSKFTSSWRWPRITYPRWFYTICERLMKNEYH